MMKTLWVKGKKVRIIESDRGLGVVLCDLQRYSRIKGDVYRAMRSYSETWPTGMYYYQVRVVLPQKYIRTAMVELGMPDSDIEQICEKLPNTTKFAAVQRITETSEPPYSKKLECELAAMRLALDESISQHRKAAALAASLVEECERKEALLKSWRSWFTCIHEELLPGTPWPPQAALAYLEKTFGRKRT